MPTKKQYRQGDVLITQAEAPKQAQPQPPEQDLVVLARGEATGHHHSVSSAEAAILAKGAERFLRVKAPTHLRHQEHKEIPLARGTYEITIQREWTPAAIRTVLD